MDYSASMNIALPIIGIGAGYFIRYLLERRKELSGKIYDERRVLYQQFVDLVIDILRSVKAEKETDITDFTAQLFEFYKKYILYASPEVINSFSDYFQFLYNENKDSKPETLYKHFGLLTCIMTGMRKDLGLKNKKLGKNGINIMRALITDFDEFKSA